MNPASRNRIARDLKLVTKQPPPGVSCWADDEKDLTKLTAQVAGPPGTPFEDGVFTLSVQFPPRYPFEPPRLRFITPVYHPNIDSEGRICLDTLKSAPMGSWSPAVSLISLLTMIRCLLESPNPDDGLMPDITSQYKRDLEGWKKEARARCERDAKPTTEEESGGGGVGEGDCEVKKGDGGEGKGKGKGEGKENVKENLAIEEEGGGEKRKIGLVEIGGGEEKRKKI